MERGEVPGVAALVARGGDVHVEVLGSLALDDPPPLRRDAIFRIASLSKPIAAAGAMTLVDDGVLALSDPVDALLPELADRRVLRTLEGPLDDTVPAERAITLEDLLTFRLGFGAIMAPPGSYPIQEAEAQLGLMTLGPPWPPPPFGSDEWIARFATLPLLHQPGAAWRYNTGAQVLGILLERASGQPLETFLRARVFEPLGMVDTSFSVPAGKQARFTTAYMPDRDSGRARRAGPAGRRLVERAAGDGERGGHVGVDARRPVGLRVDVAGGRTARGTAAAVAGCGRRHDARPPDGVPARLGAALLRRPRGVGVRHGRARSGDR